MEHVESGVQTLYYGLGILFMLGGGIGDQEKGLVEYKLYVAERYASKEFLAETKREILDSIRDLGRRMDQHS